MRVDRCAVCNEIVPEGRQICPSCEITQPVDLVRILRKEENCEVNKRDKNQRVSKSYKK